MVDIISSELGKDVPAINFPLWLGIIAALPFDLASNITGRNFRVSSARVRKLATNTKFAGQAIRDYGFRPKFTIEEGLRKMVQWYLKQNGGILAKTSNQ
jgi:nucleoside-diphosphate-sugar epimerase